jgi:hypothetical protein
MNNAIFWVVTVWFLQDPPGDNPEEDILHSHHRENLKSYIALTGWTV